jgi:hypothetical protein
MKALGRKDSENNNFWHVLQSRWQAIETDADSLIRSTKKYDKWKQRTQKPFN